MSTMTRWSRQFDVQFVNSYQPLKDGGYDRERAVLPTLIYAQHIYKIGHRASIRVIAVGWWAWGVRLRLMSRERV